MVLDTILQAIEHISARLTETGLANPHHDAKIILSHVTGIPHLELLLHKERALSTEEQQSLIRIIERRSLHEPLQYIFGESNFMGLDIKVNRTVLIPRPETELLVDKVIRDHEQIASPLRVLDIGTGSGAIAIALARLRPDWTVEATEISSEALKVAGENAERHHTTITFHLTDLFPERSVGKANQTLYDVIVSNPPYIPEYEYLQLSREVREYEPRQALLADNDGLLFYRRILEGAAEFLKPEGYIYFEIGYDQGTGIKDLAVRLNYRIVDIYRDYQQFERIVKLTRIR